MSTNNGVKKVVQGSELSDADRQKAFEELSKLIYWGLTPTQALDMYAVDVAEMDLKRWAEIRGTSPEGINQNIYGSRGKVLEVVLDE